MEDLRSTTVPDDPVQRRDLILIERARTATSTRSTTSSCCTRTRCSRSSCAWSPTATRRPTPSRRRSSRPSATCALPWRQRQVVAQPDLRQRGDGHSSARASAGRSSPTPSSRTRAGSRRPAPRQDPERIAVHAERSRAIAEALTHITDDQRTAIVLYDVEGYDYGEIAEMTGVSLGTVKSRIHRGRLALRDLLADRMDLFRG